MKFVICNACNSFLLFFLLAFNSTVLTKLYYPYIVNSKSHTTPYIVDSKSPFLLSMESHLWQLKTTLLAHLIVQNDGKSFKNFDFEFLKYVNIYICNLIVQFCFCFNTKIKQKNSFLNCCIVCVWIE